jgi:hypothetical protein
VRVDDTAFGQLVAAESGRLARLGTLLTGDPARGHALAEEALARALLNWRKLREDEPVSALRRSLFEVYGEWWRRAYRRYAPPPDAPASRTTATGAATTGEPATATTSEAADALSGTTGGATSGSTGTTGGGTGELVGAGASTSANGPYGLAARAAAATQGTGSRGSVGSAAEPTPAEPTPAGPAAEAAAGRAAAEVAAGRAAAEVAAAEEPLAGLSHWGRAVALLDAEGRSSPELVGLLGLSERTVARSRPVVPILALATALAGADLPVPVERVTARALRIQRRRRVGAALVAVLLAIPAFLALRASTGVPDSVQADNSCPTFLPGQVSNTGEGLDRTIVPISPDRTYLCMFAPDGSRLVARQLDRRLGVDISASINASRQAGETDICSRESVTPFVLAVNDGERTVSLLATPDGCGRVTNGVRTVSAGRDLLTQILAGRVNQDPEPAIQSCNGLPADLHNEGPGLAQRLVGFTGERIVVCPQQAPATVGELSGTTARALALTLDQAPTSRPATANCPSDQHLIVVVTGGVSRIDLVMDANPACGWATNGVRVVELDPETRDVLRKLARLPG